LTDFSLRPDLFIATLSGAAVFHPPVQSGESHFAAAIGALAGALIVIRDPRQTGEFNPADRAASVACWEILGAYLIALVLGQALRRDIRPLPFLQLAILALMTYCRLIVGRIEGRHAEPGRAGRPVRRREGFEKNTFKILDPSVIIDGQHRRYRRKPDLSTARW